MRRKPLLPKRQKKRRQPPNFKLKRMRKKLKKLRQRLKPMLNKLSLISNNKQKLEPTKSLKMKFVEEAAKIRKRRPKSRQQH